MNGKTSVLIIDDDRRFRDLLREFIEADRSRPVEISECSDAPDAFETLAERGFDVLLVDYRMPGTKGDELVSRVRPHHPSSYIIGMSLESRERVFRAAGADAFLMKPFEIKELLHLVHDRPRTVQNQYR